MLIYRLALFLFAMFAIEAHAATIMLLNKQIVLTPPNGYCEVGTHSVEQALVRQTSEAVGNSNRILSFFADCRELEELRSGKRQVIDNYGQIMAPSPNGQLRILKGFTRQEYLKKMSARLNADLPSAIRNAEVWAKQVVPGYQTQGSLGLLRIDSNGMYLGMLMATSDSAGKVRKIVGVLGTTLVKELPISINLYQSFSRLPDLGGLLARQQAAMAFFVRANN